MINNIPHLDQIEKMIDSDDLDGAEAALAKVEKIIKAAQPPDDQQEFCADDDGDGDCDDDEELDDDDTMMMEKLGGGGGPWPRDELMDSMTEGHVNAGEGVTPTMHPNNVGHITVDSRNEPTPFDSHCAFVARRDGIPPIAAMSRARKERPDLFADHQNSLGSVEQEHGHRRAMAKAEHVPGDSCFEDLVDIEISKGFSQTLAEQRVLHQYGDHLPRRNDDLAKVSDSLIVKFMRQVDQTMISECCDRNTAMRKVREQQPDLYEAYQLV